MYIGNQVNTNRLNSTLHEHQHFTASQADTVTNAGFYTFTVNYTPGNVQVYVRGILLASTDFTASNGTDIRIAQSSVTLESNDSVEIIGTKLDSSNILLEQSSVSISGGSIGGDTAINVKNIEADTYFNYPTYNEGITIPSDKNAMMVGPISLPSLTVNGQLCVTRSITVSGDLTVATGKTLQVI